MSRGGEDRSPDQKYESSSSRKKHHSRLRSGRITRNPFLNFLRDMRRTARGLSITEVASKGAELWRKMDEQQKQPYHQLARQARKMSGGGRRKSRKSRRRSPSRRKRSPSRRKSRSRSKRSKSRRKSRSRVWSFFVNICLVIFSILYKNIKLLFCVETKFQVINCIQQLKVFFFK